MKTRKIFFLLSLLALALTGCTSLTKREQPKHYNLTLLEDGDNLGQTFVARYDGLEGISLYLESEPGGKGILRLHLRASEQETTDLRTATLALEEIPSPDFYAFSFPPLQNSTMKDFYFVVNLEGPGSVKVGTAEGDAYINGALYLDDVPQDAQTAFLLTHARDLALLGVFKESLTWLAWSLVGLFLYVIPGWALLNLLWPNWGDLHWAEKLGLGGGLSLAIYPILLLWTHLIGLHLGPLYAWLPPLTGLAVIAWRNRKSFVTLRGKLRSKDLHIPITLSTLPWSDVALLFSIGLIFAVRFWVIRSLDAPMWGDSYQHTLIAQLIVDHGGLFDSWQPYAEMTTFTYHFGFHSLVAIFHWVTKLSMPQAVLWTGQILNGMAVIFLFPLALKINRNPWSGVIAVLIAGLLAPMPMFYLNWGRYTQLAGQAILPAAIYVAWTILEARENNRRALIPAWIVLGGLALTHYRVLIFAVIFFAVYLILEGKDHGLVKLSIKIFWMGVGAVIIFLPWVAHIAVGKYLYLFSRQITTPASQLATYTQDANAIGDLLTYLPSMIWFILAFVIGWGFWRRNKGIALMSLWWFALFVLTNPAWLNLPGTGIITNFALFIAAYIPAAVIIGGALGEAITIAQSRIKKVNERESSRGIPIPYKGLLSLTLVTVCVLSGFWGIRRRFYDPNPNGYALVTRPDVKAISWLKQATSDDAYILVNSFSAYDGAAIVGSDGGWWLPLLARRQTTLPPLPYIAERGPTPEYQGWINALWRQISNQGLDNPDTIEMLRERKVTHVYIGQRQGSVNSWDNKLELGELLAIPSFRPIYRQDRVWVFEFIP